jgi:hypothetical protein
LAPAPTVSQRADCREPGAAGAKLGSSVMFVARRRALRFASTLIADA